MTMIHALFTAFIVGISAALAAEPTPPETIKLWPDGKAPLGSEKFEDANATLTIFRPEKPNGTAIVICPGGGYTRVVGAEGAPIAQWLNTHGITGLVLNYRLPQGNPHRPLSDVRQALSLTRSNAKHWNLQPDRIGVMGFSAGGHLAAMAATQFQLKNDQQESSRPDFAILIYPVITMGSGTHAGSKDNLLGPNPNPELIRLYSNELQVTALTPPTFLAHAADDRVVTPDNSQKFRDALFTKKVPANLLKLPTGGHGLDGYQGPMWDAWQTQSMQWLQGLDTTTR